MIDFSGFNIESMILSWTISFTFIVLIWRRCIVGLLDPLAQFGFYISSLVPIPIEYIIKDTTDLKLPLISLSVIFSVLSTSLVCRKLRFLRMYMPSLTSLHSHHIYSKFSSGFLLLLCGAILISIFYISTDLKNVFSGSGAFDRYQVLRDGRDYIRTIVEFPSRNILYFASALALLNKSRACNISILPQKCFGRIPSRFLLDFAVLITCLFTLSSALTGARSSVIAFALNIGMAVSFIGWKNSMINLKYIFNRILCLAIIGLLVSVLLQYFFRLYQGISSQQDFLDSLKDIGIRIFSNADGIYLIQEYHLSSVLTENSPLRFIFGPFSRFLGIHDSRSFGNLLVEHIANTTINSGPNFNFLLSTVSIQQGLEPLVAMLMTIFGFSIRLLSTKESHFNSATLNIDVNDSIKYMYYAESFAIFSDLEYGIFKLIIISFNSCIILGVSMLYKNFKYRAV